jgi:small subunit ribosomal protein S6
LSKYETVIIINPNIELEDAEKIIEEVQNLITGSGGTVIKVDKWGKRRLAYEVKGNRDGVYVLVNFEAEPEFVQRLARYYGLTEQIIKYMTVRAEELPEPAKEAKTSEDEDEDVDLDLDESDEDEDEESEEEDEE